jgi:5-oxoprolinase (ATP-hydrolysing)
MGDGRWQFWIDRGGTFTDIVAQRPDGSLVVHKLLSENPDRYADAPLQGIRDLMGLAPDAPIPAEAIAAIKMGTTVATNALLERKGDRTLFITTAGFKDALRIGYQNRPDIFARHIQLPEMLYERVVEVHARMDAQGEILQPLTEAECDRLRTELQRTYNDGIRACAIALLHGYRYPQHEQAVAELARAVGFPQISISHQVSPLMKLVSRGDTTVVDAYLSPILRRYVDRIAAALAGRGSGRAGEQGSKGAEEQNPSAAVTPTPHPPKALWAGYANPPSLPDTRLMFMQSNGGLTDAALFQGKDSILSGPAGGIVGAVQTSLRAGFRHLIGFDMGGTSTDVSHYRGEYERTFETEVAGVRLRAPMMAIHTVAAGGGSILSFDGSRYRVGPESAGAYPGPACYRHGGPLAVTDANVMVGKLQPDFFPAVFGPGGDEPLDRETVQAQFTALADRIHQATGNRRRPEQVASGFLAIAVEKMANAIKKISVQRGYDVSDYALCCFGGAGGQHACLIAEALGMKEIFIHPYAGVLSAYGMGLADVRSLREQSVEQLLAAETMPDLQGMLDTLAQAALGELAQQGIPVPPGNGEIWTGGDGRNPVPRDHRLQIQPRAHLKYQGTDSTLIVPWGEETAMRSHFEDLHRQRYGFAAPDKALIVDTLSVEAIGQTDAPVDLPVAAPRPAGTALAPRTQVPVYMGDCWHDTPLYHRDDLCPGDRIAGPALIIEATGTNVVEPHWQAQFTEQGSLVLRHQVMAPQPMVPDRSVARTASGQDVSDQTAAAPDPVRLEIFNNLFRAIAEEMGVTLQNTSTSVNIKERLDFSCALFDAQGQLVANAPHIPVHLGSMGESVQSLIRDRGDTLQPGDVYALNNPYNGGTHLPDITVITPVFVQTNGEHPVPSAADSGLPARGQGAASPVSSVVDSEVSGTGQGANPPAESGVPATGQGARVGAPTEESDSPSHPLTPSPSHSPTPHFYVASRGHHADIGGITPGSMPPHSVSIEEEGVLIDSFPLVKGGEFQAAALRELLTTAPYPVRNVAQNIADLQAQIAANEKGAQELQKLVDHYGLAQVDTYMGHVQDNAEACVQRVIETLQDGEFTYALDDGSQIQVAIRVDRPQRRATVDFSGTSVQRTSNFNAPAAVCKAAVLYVFRTLVDDDIPLNAGCLKPLDIIIPPGSLLNPKPPAAVVAGNVEVSQAIADALYGALGVMAGSQGTMNNLTFGSDRHQYYETICGGSGAGPDFDGTDAVHTHMTNSRLTDPEVLEWRFPVLVEAFAIRPDSGGAGRHRGGHGIRRALRFREAMTASILSSHRTVAPFGLAGGQPGAKGRNRVQRADGTGEDLGSQASVQVQPGDVLIIETPGGGGYGAMVADRSQGTIAPSPTSTEPC